MDRDANDSPLSRPRRDDATIGGGDARRMQATEGNGTDEQAVREARDAMPAVHRETHRDGGTGGSDALEGAGSNQQEVRRELERSRESSSGKEPSPDLGSGGMGAGGTRGA